MTVRVRFAPAPSGSLHLGSARTALYNWLFAHKQGGTFILRIEDTDEERVSEEYVNFVMEELRWLGLEWDEGIDVGGAHEPYRQSQRLPAYRDAADRLVDGGHTYRCYCTPEELEERRNQALAEGRKPGYDGRCYRLTDKERADFEEGGRRWVLRFHVPDEGDITFTDLVTGPVTFRNSDIEDFAILRQNGMPLYALGAAIDDATMEISHVIRGIDTQSSTPRQILLLRTLGYQLPEYAHIPVVVGPSGKKLSKRREDTSIEWYQEHGYLPEAMVNYLALLGMGFGDDTILAIDEMVERFSLDRVNASPAMFDMEKLTWMNGEYIRSMHGTELAGRLESFFIKEGFIDSPPSDAEREMVVAVAPLVQTRIERLDGAPGLVRGLFVDVGMEPGAVEKVMRADHVAELLQRAATALGKLTTWDTGAIEETLRAIVGDMGLKPRTAYLPFYVAISGSTVSAPLFDSMALLGKERTLERLERALEEVGSTEEEDG